MAPTQDALYRELDLDLSWSERDLPERERTKHVHRLHPYLGKFVPQLVEALLARHLPQAKRVLDPFAGSGTTLVQSLEGGRSATGIDVAAFNCLLMEVKTRRYNLFTLERELRDALTRLETFDGDAPGSRRPTCGPGSRPAPRPSCSSSGRSSRTTSTPTCCGSCWPERPARPAARRTSTSTSRASRSSRSTGATSTSRTCRPIDRAEHFLRRYALDTLARIHEFARVRGRTASAEVLHGDVRDLKLDGTFDGVVTSPPYPG